MLVVVGLLLENVVDSYQDERKPTGIEANARSEKDRAGNRADGLEPNGGLIGGAVPNASRDSRFFVIETESQGRRRGGRRERDGEGTGEERRRSRERKDL